MAETSVPEGIVPVFLSTATQQIFKAIADTDVTDKNPYRLLQKEKLLEDIQLRAAVSDFQPLKQKILNYPNDELLLVYDYEFKYEQNFYLCITEEMKELILNPPEDVKKDELGEGEEDEFNEPIPTTPEPKEWIPLGSEQEIVENFITTTRPLLKYTVAKKRRYYGSTYEFTDYNFSTHRDCYIEIPSIPPPSEEIKEVYKLEIETGTQSVPEVTHEATQSKWSYPVNVGVQYEARVLTEEERNDEWNSQKMKEFLQAITPRVELYLQQNEIIDIFPDDYLLLADEDGIVADKSDTNLKEYQSFTDLKFSKDKVVTCIDWHPTIKGIVAVSCGEPYTFNERIELSFKIMHSISLVIIWSFTDPIHPQLFLEAPEDILCFKFHPLNPNIIVGGCINGQVVMWDITEHQERLHINRSISTQDTKNNAGIFETDVKLDHAPIVSYTALSTIDSSHSKAVTDIVWIPDHLEICHKTFKFISNSSNFSSQFISCGLDGCVLFWDLRPLSNKKPNQSSKVQPTSDPTAPFYYLNLSWKPFYKMPLQRSNQPGCYAMTSLTIREKQLTKSKDTKNINEQEPSSVPLPYLLSIGNGTPLDDSSTQLCVGSEEGELVFVNWIPGKDPESGKPAPPCPDYFFSSAHSGSMATVERSPFFTDVVLTVGGWNFCIWKEGISSDALLRSGNSQVILTGGAWSPTRPGVFFICKQNGNIDIWDLMDRSHVPSLAQNISSLPLTYIIPWSLSSKQLMLGVGDSTGTLHILEIPWSLSHSSSSELSIMESFFDREVQRLKFVEERNRMREQEKKLLDEKKKSTEEEEAKAVDKGGTNLDDEAEKEYEEYLKLEKKLLIELGLMQAEET